MKQRNVAMVMFLSFITVGIYTLFWLNDTRKELMARGAKDIPGMWMLLLPVFISVGLLLLFLIFGLSSFGDPNNPMGFLWFIFFGVYMLSIMLWYALWIYWLYKYSQAVELVTKGRTQFSLSFLLGTATLLLGFFFIWPGIIQDGFNALATEPDATPLQPN